MSLQLSTKSIEINRAMSIFWSWRISRQYCSCLVSTDASLARSDLSVATVARGRGERDVTPHRPIAAPFFFLRGSFVPRFFCSDGVALEG